MDPEVELITLLPEQAAFVDRAMISHAILVAGPGTGKTFTLAITASRAVADGLRPAEVSVMTLTRSMAASLAERIPNGRASTVHAFALGVLNRLEERRPGVG